MDWLSRSLWGNFGGIEPRSIAAPIPPRPIEGRGFPEVLMNPPKPTEAQIIAIYQGDDQPSMTVVAERLGCSKEWVSRILGKHNIEKRKKQSRRSTPRRKPDAPPKRVNITSKIEPDLKEWYQAQAKAEDCSLGEIVRRALQAYRDRHPDR